MKFFKTRRKNYISGLTPFKWALSIIASSVFLSALFSNSVLATEVQYEKQYKKQYKTILGQKMAYIDEGQGQAIVFLHGNPTSSYLWRNIIPYVSKNYRAIAPDLMGMGDSAKPDLTYSYSDQAKYLHGFLDSLDLKDAILVVHDWGSALGFHYARTRSSRISAIAFMEATLPPYFPIPSLEAMGPSADFLKNVRTQGIGEEMILKKNVLIDQFLRYSNPEHPMSDNVIAQYNGYYSNEKSRQPLLQWLREIPINGTPANVHEIGLKNNKWIIESEIPKLLFYVTPGVLVPEATVKYMENNAKNIKTIGLGPAGHFMQEVYSDEIGTGLAEWLETINPSSLKNKDELTALN